MQTLGDILSTIAADGAVSAQEVLSIRAAIYPDVAISPAEADGLFALNDRIGAADPEWRALFIEALCDYVVRQQDPAGYVDDRKADWLLARITADNRIKTHTEFDLLIRVIELAREAPARLSETALDYAVSFALSPERRAGQGHTITAEEVSRIRRVVWATAGDGGVVTRREAAALFALNDASRGQPNDPAWRDLFVKAIGAALLAAAYARAPSRDEARRAEAWLATPTEGVASILGRTVGELAKAALTRQLPGFELDELGAVHKARNRDKADATKLAEALNAEEADWLIAQIGKDGQLDDNEKALVRFVAEEAGALDPRLQPLIAAAQSPSPTAQEMPKPKAPSFGRRAG